MAFFGFTLLLEQGSLSRTITELEISTFQSVDEAKNGAAYLRREFVTPITFTGADFDWLYSIETDTDRCDEITATLTHEDGFTWSGLLRLSDTDWLVDECRVTLRLYNDDKYECMEKLVLDDEFNLLERESLSVQLYEGTLEPDNNLFEDYGPDTSEYPPPVTDPTDPAWTFLSIEAENIGGYWTGNAAWVRQSITTTCVAGVPEPPGTPNTEGWTLRVNDCAGSGTATWTKPVRVIPAPGIPPVLDGETWRVINIVPNTLLSGGRALNPLLEDLFDGSCPAPVISDFLGINPEGDAPSNSAYDVAPRFQNILIFQRSDIRLPNAAQDATIGRLKLKTILEGLEAALRLKWFFDESGNFRIEHESFFTRANGFDLTTDGVIISRARYQRIDSDYPRYQGFAWDESYRQQDFEGVDIIYNNACGKDVQQFQAPFSTDIASVIADPSRASDTGFMWVSTVFDGTTYRVITVPGALSGVEILNGHFAWANLHDPIHLYERPFASGNVNGSVTTMETVAPTRRQQVTAVICPSDWHTIDTNEKVKTTLGWGKVERVTYDYATQTAEFTILHD